MQARCIQTCESQGSDFKKFSRELSAAAADAWSTHFFQYVCNLEAGLLQTGHTSSTEGVAGSAVFLGSATLSSSAYRSCLSRLILPIILRHIWQGCSRLQVFDCTVRLSVCARNTDAQRLQYFGPRYPNLRQYIPS